MDFDVCSPEEHHFIMNILWIASDGSIPFVENVILDNPSREENVVLNAPGKIRKCQLENSAFCTSSNNKDADLMHFC